MLQIGDNASFGREFMAGRKGRMLNSSPSGGNGGSDFPLFAGNPRGGLSKKYGSEPHLKEPLDTRFGVVPP